MAEPDMSKYAERLTVVVRTAPQGTALAPEFETASVVELDVGPDGGVVPFEVLQPTVMTWQQESGYAGWSYVEHRQQHVNVGAAGADAVILVTLLNAAVEGGAGGMADGVVTAILARLKGLRPHRRAPDAETLARELCLAADRRRGELDLIEYAEEEGEARAVFRDRDGITWELVSARGRSSIRRI